jgi:hypothetical protein
MGLAAASSIGLGMPNLPVARVIGHPGVQSKEMLERNVLEVTLEQVIDNLLKAPQAAGAGGEPGARDVVVKGGFQEVNDFFYDHGLSDGLPIVPPTREKVEQFLRFTDRDPGESLGALLPDSRAATVWSIAVNGVMAGCRPEYMPVLVALIEAMADPAYGVEHSGNTPGGETLIIVNGPVIQQLGFNYTQGVMRDGFRPNTAIGRILRDWTQKPTWNLVEEARAGRIPAVFHASDDPNRRVPLVWKPEDYMLAVTGDLTRNSVYVFAHNGVLGYPVAKRIR